jgi:hypothetical protein
VTRFTYVADVPYATDPATVADVAVGDWIHVESDPTLRTGNRGYAFDGQVTAVASDEFGMYFHVEGVRLGYGARHSLTANTIVDRIRQLDGAPA